MRSLAPAYPGTDAGSRRPILEESRMRSRLSFLALLCLALAPLPTTTFAATTLSGLEAMTTTVFQEGQTSFSGLALRAAFGSDLLFPGVTLLSGIEWWRNSTKVESYELSADRRDVTLAFDARYTFEFRNVQPYLGMGYGMHFLNTEVSAPTLGLPRAENALIKGGVSGHAGLLFPVGSKFQNLVEVKYHHVTDYRQWKLNLGVTYGF